MPEAKTPEIVIWGDGAGSTAGAVLDAIGHGLVKLSVTGVISANPDAGIFDQVRAAEEQYGFTIKTKVVEGESGKRQTSKSEAMVLDFLDEMNTHNLALLGCMTIVGSSVVSSLNGEVPNEPLPQTLEEARGLLIPGENGYYNKVPLDLLQPEMGTEQYSLVNFHPALTDLTANTYGRNASKRILQLRANKTAWTMHAVASSIDTGPKIAVHPVQVADYGQELSGAALDHAAQKLFDAVQAAEKMHGPIELAAHYARHEAWLQRNVTGQSRTY